MASFHRFLVLLAVPLLQGACAGAPIQPEADQSCIAKVERLGSDWHREERVDIYREGCIAGDNRCCVRWVDEEFQGHAAEADEGMLRACDQSVGACLHAGDLVRPTSPEGAAPFFRLACEDRAQRLARQTSLKQERAKPGECYHFHQGVCATSIPEDLEGCRQALSRLMEDGQFTVAREVSSLLCRWPETSGCATLGKLWSEGKGGDADPDQALSALKLGCDKGNERACALVPTAKQGIEAKARFERCDDVPSAQRTTALPPLSPGANQGNRYSTGPVAVNSVRFCSGLCHLERPASNLDAFVVWLVLGQAIASARKSLVACGAKDSVVLMNLKVSEGKLTSVDAQGPWAGCVEKALAGAKASFLGTCSVSVRMP